LHVFQNFIHLDRITINVLSLSDALTDVGKNHNKQLAAISKITDGKGNNYI